MKVSEGVRRGKEVEKEVSRSLILYWRVRDSACRRREAERVRVWSEGVGTSLSWVRESEGATRKVVEEERLKSCWSAEKIRTVTLQSIEVLPRSKSACGR